MELLDKTEQQTPQNIANELKEVGHNVEPKDVSAKPKFPTDLIEGIGGEIVDEVHDLTKYIEAKKEGSSYIDTTPSKNIISIASIRNKLLGKKAA